MGPVHGLQVSGAVKLFLGGARETLPFISACQPLKMQKLSQTRWKKVVAQFRSRLFSTLTEYTLKTIHQAYSKGENNPLHFFCPSVFFLVLLIMQWGFKLYTELESN